MTPDARTASDWAAMADAGQELVDSMYPCMDKRCATCRGRKEASDGNV